MSSVLIWSLQGMTLHILAPAHDVQSQAHSMSSGLDRWTNGYFRSTLHRVVNNVGKERYSTAFFYDPNFTALVECLPQCCKEEPAKYPPVTSGQHVLDKYAATHAAYGGPTRLAEG